MASDADLDSEIKSLSVLSEKPELYEFAKLGYINSPASLDIAIGAIQTISEFTGEDVEAEQEQWNILVNGVYLLWSFEC